MVLISLAIFFESLLTIWIDKKTCDSRALSSLTQEGTPDNLNDAGIGTNIAEKQEHGPSDYF